MGISERGEITLNLNEVANILKDWVKDHTGKDTDFISFHVTSTTANFNGEEFTKQEFSGATIYYV